MSGTEREPVSEKAAAAAARLRIDAATAEVVRALDADRLRTRVLKGPALADWYEPDRTTSYLDCDLWVHPDDLNAAEHELTELGFQRDFDERAMPDWWVEHAGTWSRQDDAVSIDLHRTLQGIDVDPRTAWEILCDPPVTVQVAGYRATRLPEPARATYVTLHAAHHGEEWGKAITHLERALAVLDEATWQRAAELAALLGAIDQFSAGLRLVPKGAELASRLGLGVPSSVTAILQAQSPPPTALGFARLADAGGTRRRAAILLRKAFPPPAFIRHWWPPAGRSPVMLVVGYLYRPLWLIRSARHGLPAWWRARSGVRR